jgi:hypothetical protein
MASSEILLIVAGSGCLALCGSKCDLVAIVCVLLLARFRGRVQSVIAASALSLVTVAIGHRFPQEFIRNGETATAIGAIWCCAFFALSSKSNREPASGSNNPFDEISNDIVLAVYPSASPAPSLVDLCLRLPGG